MPLFTDLDVGKLTVFHTILSCLPIPQQLSVFSLSTFAAEAARAYVCFHHPFFANSSCVAAFHHLQYGPSIARLYTGGAECYRSCIAGDHQCSFNGPLPYFLFVTEMVRRHPQARSDRQTSCEHIPSPPPPLSRR